MLQILLIAGNNLRFHVARTLLLGGAIAGTIALLTFLLAIAAGAERSVFETATTLVTGHLNVTGVYKARSSQAFPVVTRAPGAIDVVRREIPPEMLDLVVERTVGQARLVSASRSLSLAIEGVDIQREKGLAGAIRVLSGRLEDVAQPGTILLFEAQAKKLGVDVGDVITLTAQTAEGVNNTLDARVVAVARSAGLLSDYIAFLSLESVRTLYQIKPDATGMILVYVKDLSQVAPLRRQLRESLGQSGFRLLGAKQQPLWTKLEGSKGEDWTGQKVDVSTWMTEVSTVDWVINGIRALSGLLTFVMLVVIVVGVTNALWISIHERTREIGTLRAIGMGRSRVMAMVFAEAMLLGLAGSLVGIALGALGCGLLNLAQVPLPSTLQMLLMSERLRLVVSPGPALLSAAACTTFMTLASMIPAYRAAGLRPVVAMGHGT